MNYARIEIPAEKQEETLTETAKKLGERTGLSPVVDMGTGEIILKGACVIPFFRETKGDQPDRIEFYSVDSHGLPFNPPDPKWAEYRGMADMSLDSAMTYLGALFKALLCETADKEIDDDGASNYREDPNLPKFKSLTAWKSYIRERQNKRQLGTITKFIDKYITKERASIDALERELFPELKP